MSSRNGSLIDSNGSWLHCQGTSQQAPWQRAIRRYGALWKNDGKRGVFRAATPPARQIENWRGVVFFAGNHAVFGFDPALWRAGVGPLTIREVRRKFDH